MNQNISALVSYRLEQAEESLDAASLLLKELWDVLYFIYIDVIGFVKMQWKAGMRCQEWRDWTALGRCTMS